MSGQRLETWEKLFQHALSFIDAAVAAGASDYRRSYDECVGLVKKALG